jgi:hypothetical protein
MENSVELLMKLSGASTTNKNLNVDEMDPRTLETEVKKLFRRLDVDGDGLITWWEWKCVLTSVLLGRHPNSIFIDPLDPLCIGLLATDAAMKAHKSSLLTVLTTYTKESNVSAMPFIYVGEQKKTEEITTDENGLDVIPPSKGKKETVGSFIHYRSLPIVNVV